MKLRPARGGPQARRFYDGGVDAERPARRSPGPRGRRPDRAAPAHRARAEQFAMERRIAYRDRHLGELLVPRRTGTFRTDLTSVPALFTWLVPKTGRHLPAALVHDGLVHPPRRPDLRLHRGARVLRPRPTGCCATRWPTPARAWSGAGWCGPRSPRPPIFSGAGTGWSRGATWRYRVAAGSTLLYRRARGLRRPSTCSTCTSRGAPAALDGRPAVAGRAGSAGSPGAVVVPLGARPDLGTVPGGRAGWSG